MSDSEDNNMNSISDEENASEDQEMENSPNNSSGEESEEENEEVSVDNSAEKTRCLELVQMACSDQNSSEFRPDAIIDFFKDIGDFNGIYESAPGEVKSYAEQEADDSSAFNENVSCFTITHLTPDLLNEIGKPMTNKTGSPFYGWINIHPSLPPKGINSGARMSLEGREYNGVAVNVKTGELDVYRYNLNKMRNSEPMRPSPTQMRQHFAKFFDNKNLRDLVIVNKNRRTASYKLPLATYGINVVVTLPYVPVSIYSLLKKEAHQDAKKQRAKKALELKSKKESAAPKSTNESAATPQIKKTLHTDATGADKKNKKPASSSSSQESDKFKKIKKTELPVEEASLEEVSPDEMVAALKNTKAQLSQAAKKQIEIAQSPVNTKSLSRKRKEPSSSDLEVVTLTVPKKLTRLSKADEVTATNILGHFRAKSDEKWKVSNPFAGKKTLGAMLADEQSKYALYAVYGFFEHFAPHVIGLAHTPSLPASLPDIDAGYFL